MTRFAIGLILLSGASAVSAETDFGVRTVAGETGMVRVETDPKAQRVAMRAYEKHTLDTAAHVIVMPYWYRIVMARSYVKGWKISPSHYLNQDLANIWLDK